MFHTVIQLKNGQKVLTLPSRMAEAYQLTKGSRLTWSYIHKAGKITGLKIEKAEVFRKVKK